MPLKVVGLDLAGAEKNPTGFFFLGKEKGKVKLLFSDSEILEEIERVKPDVIAIDAPLSFPKHGFYRDGDILLRKLGVKPLSPKFPGMRMLVARGIRLANVIRKISEVIEVYPYASANILNIHTHSDLKRFGSFPEPKNKDEFDALLCALTA